MIGDVKPSTKYMVRTFFVLLLVGGLALLAAAVRDPEPPTEWWVLGGLATLLGGSFVASWIRYRIRYPTREARERARQEFVAIHRSRIDQLERGELVRRAVRDKPDILRVGSEATAIVSFLADVNGGGEFPQLVYLELDVKPAFGSGYTVKTGEELTAASVGTVTPGRELVVRVDPKDRERVAVDWEASLRLRRPTPAGG